MDSETLTLLLRGEHVDMSERIKRGIWPHAPIKLAEVINHLARVIESEKWFPREWKPAVPGDVVCEGGVIERQSPSTFLYRARRHNAINPNEIIDQTEKIFTSSEAAAHFYLKWDLNLPGDLDGWKVVA